MEVSVRFALRSKRQIMDWLQVYNTHGRVKELPEEKYYLVQKLYVGIAPLKIVLIIVG